MRDLDRVFVTFPPATSVFGVCPHCGSEYIIRYGYKYQVKAKFQRMLCRGCEKTYKIKIGEYGDDDEYIPCPIDPIVKPVLPQYAEPLSEPASVRAAHVPVCCDRGIDPTKGYGEHW